ncbi:hypothetical protein NADFUDRAFT_46567 [Nadsonia fulvescens var. elongata DSM 6958]|uniref:Dynamin-type G domain-containing protein n=1 Tax=Nadsonia fulvescens var. elongata DSM 6958 TaxID=857566 RepID=A0A1E3PKQ8_9ASCO|nr:hypothetical protein NADFUDRAFT_46567 [Nadsonia fulvescens var. elongata DSM 6958]
MNEKEKEFQDQKNEKPISTSSEASGNSTPMPTDEEIIQQLTANMTNTNDTRFRSPSFTSQKFITSQFQQLHYNESRITLSNSINAVKQMFISLQEFNRSWPIYYPPQGQNVPNHYDSQNEETNLENHRNTQHFIKNVKPFSLLKLDLRLGTLSNIDLVHSLENTAVSTLLENRIKKILGHLASLQERIDDTSSKVLITGDVNSGKSTFANALMRRNVLPDDQLPCTEVFCEVIDASHNHDLEEVHAIGIGEVYDIRDVNTYEIFPLQKLEDLVLQVDKYAILKVYVHDTRSQDKSLLRNGVVDIALIDGPGLNLNSFHTTQVFARQEEIDLVVFVVSATNQITQSAIEFITSAANEKSFIFIVVNKFDVVRDKTRCVKRIMDQIADISPATHKGSRDFVHFVSSENIVKNFPRNESNPGDDGSDDDNDDNGNQDPDFDRLENSLRDFVLEKRCLSKLAPAKTYLLNAITDITTLSLVNKNKADELRCQASDELSAITPTYEDSISQNARTTIAIEEKIEKISADVSEKTRLILTSFLSYMGDIPAVKYEGIFSVYDYANATRDHIVQNILKSLSNCEDYSRNKTSDGVKYIKDLGSEKIGNDFMSDKLFRDDLMFTRRKDTLARSIKAPLDFSDFYDIKLLDHLPSFPELPMLPSMNSLSSIGRITDVKAEEVSTVSNALTLATVVGTGRLVQSTHMIRNFFQLGSYLNARVIRKVMLPILIVASIGGIAYLINDIPNAIPKKLAKKIKREIDEMGYVSNNSDRIAKECRHVLRYPARDVRDAFEKKIQVHSRKKEEILKRKNEANDAYRFFNTLLGEATNQNELVESCNLDVVMAID